MRASVTPADPGRPELPAVAALWPAGYHRLTRRPGRSPALLVLPSRRSPRMLVPTGVAAAGAMLRRHSTGRRQRLGQQVLARGVRSGLLPWLPLWRLVPTAGGGGIDSIEDHVRDALPAAAAVGVLLGPPRANAKPVLRVFDADGRTLAFGKVGYTELSRALVRREGRILRELAGTRFTCLEVPSVLHAGPWGELEVLLLTPLGSSGDDPGKAAPRPVPTSWELPLAAMVELAEHGGVTREAVASSAYFAGLRQRVDAVPPSARGALECLLGDVSRRAGAVVLGFGRWHGDWAPWNMGGGPRPGRPVQVWDWERSQPGVPLGFDVVHFLLQREFGRATPQERVTQPLLGTGSRTLERWCPEQESVEATILLYLLDILARYRTDVGGGPTPQLQARVATLEGVAAAIIADHPRRPRADA